MTEYEEGKEEVVKKNLTPEEYEKAIKDLCKKLNI